MKITYNLKAYWMVHRILEACPHCTLIVNESIIEMHGPEQEILEAIKISDAIDVLEESGRSLYVTFEESCNG